MRTATFAGAWAAATGTVTAVSIAVGRGDALSRRSSADPAGSLASHGADGASSSEEPGAGRRAGGAETVSGPSRDGCAPPPRQRLHSQAPEGPRVSRLWRCVTSSPDLRGVREPRLALRCGFSSASFVPGVHGPCVAKASRAVRRSSVSEDRAERARGWGPRPQPPRPARRGRLQESGRPRAPDKKLN